MIIAIFSTIGGVVGIGILGKTLFIFSGHLLKDVKRRFDKRKLKEKLNNKIDELDYNGFLDTIYEIKNYDRKFDKNQYSKCKYHYKFSERILREKDLFLQRFDPNYENNDIFLQTIKREIELSLQKLRSEFGSML